MSPRREREAEPPRALRLPPLLAEALREGTVSPTGSAPSAGALRIALLVRARGQRAVAELATALERRGHALDLLPAGDGDELPARVDHDVVVATGWQTAPAAMRLPGAGARALLLGDYEPDLHPSSAERHWAAWAYEQGLHAICAGPWLARVLVERHGASATPFDVGVDHDVFRAHPHHRRHDAVAFFAPAGSPRSAVPLGVLALAELHRRRPEVEIALFGDARDVQTPFPHRHLGVLAPASMAEIYAAATAGLVLSLTNPPGASFDMLACGLPVVAVSTDAARATFGADGPVALSAPDPSALADALGGLLDDLATRADRTLRGMELVAPRTWAAAAEQVEDGLRAAIRSSARP